jgi:precorrin-6B methylase 2
MSEVQKKRSEKSISELKKLTKIFKEDSTMCEIGCYAGESTIVFLESNKIKKLYAVDPWKSGYDKNDSASFSDMYKVEKEFDKKIKPHKVVKLKMTFEEAFEQIPELDIVYIDGNHKYEYVLKDIINSLKKIKDGGIISGHDYGSKKHVGVTKAVDEIFGKPDIVFGDKSWVKYIKK